ncbi:MAG: tetratricopeptide repeat protein [Armatimonadetes bacterium]|nr:tetratricopeptide repeat protein [Armatimonadota bacterium]MBS1712543.1 tetratricopeptide repeat protein [Armatimonadota bacterium]MBX3109148.1 tetratricopeptide repeat protein [Fimbriimonadaceae bacterium]
MKLNRTAMSIALVACLTVAGGINRWAYPLWRVNFSPRKNSDLRGLSGDQLLIALAGFREMVAGILWVRADTFFDEGNYDAILPIIRLVTMLDPKQIDVYATGMWHIAYNFTDEQNRSDRRYIPSALALGAEGSQNNDYTYELYFETGWLWYHKIDDDYDKAVSWWEKASTKKDIQTARRNILSMAYLRSGDFDKAIAHYEELLGEAETAFQKTPNDFAARQQRDTLETNLDNVLVRLAQRGNFALKGGYYDQGDYDTKPPYDVGFSARVTVEDSKVLRVEGTWGVQPVGTRIRIVLRDADDPNGRPAEMVWERGDKVDLDPDREATFMQDGLFVKNQAFYRRIDMSRDPTMYPFTTDKYVVEFYYNIRSGPPHLQDRFGYSGEGMTDARYMNTEVRPGQRVIYAKLELTRDQLLRQGEWATKVPVVQTDGFVTTGTNQSTDVIKIPTLRSDREETTGN